MGQPAAQASKSAWQSPARLTAEQAGWFINCQAHDVPILMAARLLKPLGNPAANGSKYFAALELLELAKNKMWLVKVTNAVNQHWQRNNATKKYAAAQNGHGAAVREPAVAGV